MQRTPLIDQHRAAGAKLVGFAGWEMPLHYGSQIEEHHAVRGAVGVFDTSHMLAIDVTGTDVTGSGTGGVGKGAARTFLRRLLANDVTRLARPGQALYSCMLAGDGGVLDDLIVYFLGPDCFRLVVNAGTAEKDLAWIAAQQPGEVTLAPRRDLAMLAVQGPGASACLSQALPALGVAAAPLTPFSAVMVGAACVARTGYTGEDGFEILLPAADAAPAWRALVAAGARPCGLGARDTLRLEAGMPLYGQEMDESVTPIECGLGWTVRLANGRDFIGKDALLARPPRFHASGLVLDTPSGVLRHGQPVEAAAAHGVVTSGGFSPTLKRSIALARTDAALAPGTQAGVTVRERRLEARVVKPPFVRHGKILV